MLTITDEPRTRSLRLLNANGDTVITWEEDADEEMEKLIEKKMAAGVSFFIVAPRKPGQKGRVAKPKLLKDAGKAREHRALSIPDEDFSKFVLEGKGRAERTDAPAAPSEPPRRAKSAREVAKGHSVGVAPVRGG